MILTYEPTHPPPPSTNNYYYNSLFNLIVNIPHFITECTPMHTTPTRTVSYPFLDAVFMKDVTALALHNRADLNYFYGMLLPA